MQQAENILLDLLRYICLLQVECVQLRVDLQCVVQGLARGCTNVVLIQVQRLNTVIDAKDLRNGNATLIGEIVITQVKCANIARVQQDLSEVSNLLIVQAIPSFFTIEVKCHI